MASSRKSLRADVGAALAAFLTADPLEGRQVRVALSGGVDSVVLLHALRPLADTHGFRLSARHVNHGLSAHADRWQEHCAALCGRLGVDFSVRRVQVSDGLGRGLEAAAREARMAALNDGGADCIALAQQRDDQAETLLFRLVRGTGLRGAAAIPARERRADGVVLLRPLLAVGRREIERYARAQRLVWVDDESNQSTAFARNFIRHEVMPLLSGRFPAAGSCIARAAAHFRESLGLLDALAELDWQATGNGPTLDRQALVALAEPRQRNLLRWRIAMLGLDAPDEPRLREAVRQLRTVSDEHPLHLPLGRTDLCHYRGRAWIAPALGARSPDIRWGGEPLLGWQGGEVLFEACEGDGIARAALEGGIVTLGCRREGESLRLARGGAARSMKNLAQEAGVPPWMRDRLPMLRCGERLLWAAELGIEASAACPPGAPGLRLLWRPPAGVISRPAAPPAAR